MHSSHTSDNVVASVPIEHSLAGKMLDLAVSHPGESALAWQQPGVMFGEAI